MTILVTAATGTIGSHLLVQLDGEGVEVRALTRGPDKANLSAHVTPVRGDMLDVDATKAAL